MPLSSRSNGEEVEFFQHSPTYGSFPVDPSSWMAAYRLLIGTSNSFREYRMKALPLKLNCLRCRKMADGRWQMAEGRWQMADGRWQMADGRWQKAIADSHRHLTALWKPGFSIIIASCVLVLKPRNQNSDLKAEKLPKRCDKGT